MTTTDRTRALPTWLVLAGVEARLILRNRTAAVTATVMPVGLAVLWMVNDTDIGGSGTAGVVATELMMLLGFSVYLTSTMTLAARRGQLFLKRIRSSPAATAGIIAGLAATPIGLCLAQSAVLVGLTVIGGGSPPDHPELLLLAVVAGGITCAALAFLTASFTSTPEAAQITTAPIFGVLIAGLVWVLTTPPAEVGWGRLAVPGGAVTQLARYAWSGPESATATLPPVVASLVVALLSCLVAARLFRWEPRH